MAEGKGVAPFEVHKDASTLGLRWKRWLRAFQLYLVAKGTTDPRQKQAVLLHSAGQQVQDVYFSLAGADADLWEVDTESPTGQGAGVVTGTNTPDVYVQTIRLLTSHFAPQVNESYERQLFKDLIPNGEEVVDDYILRLREQAMFCGFEGSEFNKAIRDQFISSWPWPELKKELYTETLRSNGLSLEKTQELARLHERVRQQTGQLSLGPSTDHQVSRVKVDYHKGNRKGRCTSLNANDSRDGATGPKCYRCGQMGHFRADKNCPAWGATCNKCGMADHYAKVCRTADRASHSNNGKKGQGSKQKKKVVRQVKEDQGDSSSKEELSDDEYAFTIRAVSKTPKEDLLPVTVGGVELMMLVDSGSKCNIVDTDQWEKLKKGKVKCISKRASKKLIPYGDTSPPLEVIGTFQVRVTVSNGKSVKDTEFVVFNGKGIPILGKETAEKLGVLKVGLNVNTVKAKVNMITKSNIVEQFENVFTGTGKLKDFQLSIPTKAEVKPVIQATRRIPFNLREPLEMELHKLLKHGIIERVEGHSPWVSPVHMVPKKTGEWRLTIDMRQANMAIERERYPIPTVEELLLELNGSTVYSKLDFNQAFHQIELTEESRTITTFTTHLGLFRFTRLIFGASCAPEKFQKIMTEQFQGSPGVVIFFDDFVIHGKDESEHDKRLLTVMNKIQQKGLTLNKAKCEFGVKSLEFVGHKISANGYEPADHIQEAVIKFREPQNTAEVKSFLGLVNFSARFLPEYATLSEPMRKLTKKNAVFHWGPKEATSFKLLKEKLATPPVLGFYDKEARTVVTADASPVGLGSVLTQIQGDGPRVIQYASRALSEVETRYSQTEKEALALVWACEKFRMYLYGKSFDLVTDHRPLETIFRRTSKACARIERWVLRLMSFDFRVIYKPGKSNIADPLSRLGALTKKPRDPNATEWEIFTVLSSSVPKSMSLSEIRQATLADKDLQDLTSSLQTQRWAKDLRFYELIESELCVVDDILLRGTRIVLPKSLQQRSLELSHEGHMGIVAMKQRLRSKVWWRNMDKDIEQYVKTCHGCQLVSSAEPPEPMVRTKLPSRAWEFISADFLGPLPSGHNILAVVDYYSRYLEIVVTKSTSGETVIKHLDIMFSRYLLPDRIATDNGPCFRDSGFQEFLSTVGVEHHFKTPLWPQANGEIERQNRSMLKRMRIAQATGKDWQRELQTYLAAYRATPHSVTCVPPAQLMFGRPVRCKLPDFKLQGTQHPYPKDEDLHDRDLLKKHLGKIYSDSKRHAKESSIAVGDEVLMRQAPKNKLSTPFRPDPVMVTARHGSSVQVKATDGSQYERNTSYFKPYNRRATDGNSTVLTPPVDTPGDTETNGAASPEQPDSPAPVTPKREQRVRRIPRKLKDYIL